MSACGLGGNHGENHGRSFGMPLREVDGETDERARCGSDTERARAGRGCVRERG